MSARLPAQVVLDVAMTEDDLLRSVRELAQLRGWWCFHVLRSRGSEAGLPDLLLVRPPRVVFLELKRENGRLSAAQRSVLAFLGACPGVEALLIRPRDWERVEALLR